MHEGTVLSLVIPAYNEEEAVEATLRRSVAAFESGLESYGIDKVEVILVSDGSRDKTLERALSVPGVRVVSYEANRGYGKAIETGYAAATGNYLAFMDSDGTCDPAFLLTLWKTLQERDADVVLGCRLHAGSKMPRIRRVGNQLYAWLLSGIAGETIRDTASGMRLLKRDLLPRILPLPGGLHYTPAMSARCVLDPGIRIEEVDMPYEERTGESKLNVVKDGLVFLQTILVTALYYTPLRIFGSIGLLGAALGVVAMPWVHPWTVLLRWSLPWLVLSGGLGLLYHFFSKQILPSWPSSPLERSLQRWLHPVPLLFAGLVAWGLAFVVGVHHPDWTLLFAAAGGVGLFVASGRFILQQMNLWMNRQLPVDQLLDGASVTDT